MLNSKRTQLFSCELRGHIRTPLQKKTTRYLTVWGDRYKTGPTKLQVVNDSANIVIVIFKIMAAPRSEKKTACAEPICASKKDAMRSMFNKTGATPSSASPSSAEACPPDREELGTHSWTLVCSTAVPLAAPARNLPTSCV